MPESVESIDVIRDRMEQVSGLMQQIEDSIQEPDVAKELVTLGIKIRFPRGVITTARQFRSILRCFDRTTRRNIGYALQLVDVLCWLLNRFDIGLSAKDMIVKVSLITLASVAEAMIYDWLNYHCQTNPQLKPNKKFNKNIDKLYKHGIISADLKDRLHDLRKKRDNIHLHRLSDWELGKYDIKNHNEALKALHDLKEVLYNAS